MGMYQWLYVGPYIEITLDLVSSNLDLCKKKECPNKGETPFCSLCGIPSNQRFQEIIETAPPLNMVLVDHLKEALFSSGGQRLNEKEMLYPLVPNHARPNCPRNFFCASNTDLCIDIQSLKIEDEVLWLKDAFYLEWQELSRIYGKIPVFKWGVLQWFS